jgi:ribonuclease BN (tRNA processing enzyme)
MTDPNADLPALELTVLASSGGRASGYLLSGLPAGPLLIDCGPGVSSALVAAGLLHEFSGVVLTHGHADHAADVIGLADALRFPDPRPDMVPLWATAHALGVLRQLDEIFAVASLPDIGRSIAASFTQRELPGDGIPIDLGGATLTAFETRHAVPARALRVETPSGVLALSGDTAWCDGLIAAARDADIFLCEATYLTAAEEVLTGHGHLTAELAGRAAAEANVRRLVLIHLSAGDDPSAARDLAAGAAPGVSVEVAEVGDVFRLEAGRDGTGPG